MKPWRIEGNRLLTADPDIVAQAVADGVTLECVPGARLLRFAADGGVCCRECGVKAVAVIKAGAKVMSMQHAEVCEAGELLARIAAAVYSTDMPEAELREVNAAYADLAARLSGCTVEGLA